jgi:integrase
LCWNEASRQERARPGYGHSLRPLLENITSHQLVFADTLMALRLQYVPKDPPEPARRRLLAPPHPFIPAEGFGQYRLFEQARDLSRFDRPRHSEWLNDAMRQPHLQLAMRTAERLAQLHGWSDRLAYDVGRGVIIALACRPPDERALQSELASLAQRGISVMRVAAVLAEAGLLVDDCPDTGERYWHRRLADVSPAIRQDVLDWLGHIRHGSHRSKPRLPKTANEYCRVVAPIVRRWSATHEHLREITSADIQLVIDDLPAHSRAQALVILRSLFKYLKREKRIFANPAARLRPGRVNLAALLPMEPTDYRDAVAVATTPERRVALVLAAVHAARPADIRTLKLDDIDLGARRLTIRGHTRSMDDLTHKVLLEHLNHRKKQWPNTANPHVLLTSRTAYDTRPVCRATVITLFQGLNATLGRLGVDRQLEEALAHGPDPLQLSAVFGISHGTAMRYADAARRLLSDDQP